MQNTLPSHYGQKAAQTPNVTQQILRTSDFSCALFSLLFFAGVLRVTETCTRTQVETTSSESRASDVTVSEQGQGHLYSRHKSQSIVNVVV